MGFWSAVFLAGNANRNGKRNVREVKKLVQVELEQLDLQRRQQRHNELVESIMAADALPFDPETDFDFEGEIAHERERQIALARARRLRR